MVMYLSNKKEDNYIGFFWIFLYFSWNFEYCMRFFGSYYFHATIVHLASPLLRCLINFEFSIWFPSRVTMLWLYIVLIIPLKNEIFPFDLTKYTGTDYCDTLLYWSVFNLIFAMLHLYFWFGKYLPSLKEE